MGQYSRVVTEKCPSGGSALLSLSEADMEKRLNMGNPLHRRKLMLALQDKKSPHTYVETCTSPPQNSSPRSSAVVRNVPNEMISATSVSGEPGNCPLQMPS